MKSSLVALVMKRQYAVPVCLGTIFLCFVFSGLIVKLLRPKSQTERYLEQVAERAKRKEESKPEPVSVLLEDTDMVDPQPIRDRSSWKTPSQSRRYLPLKGDVFRLTDELWLFDEPKIPPTEMAIKEHLVGILRSGERAECRETKGWIGVYCYIVSQERPSVRGWCVGEMVKATKIK